VPRPKAWPILGIADDRNGSGMALAHGQFQGKIALAIPGQEQPSAAPASYRNLVRNFLTSHG